MPTLCYNRVMKHNLLHHLPNALPAEVFDTLLQTDALKIERIVSHGQHSAPDFWYDQPQAEWVLVLQGAARLQLAEGFVELRAGDYLNIAAHQKHRVDWTDPTQDTVWLAIFY